jgi:hypothetical protein
MFWYVEVADEFRRFRVSVRQRVVSISFALCLFLNIGFVTAGWAFIQLGLIP